MSPLIYNHHYSYSWEKTHAYTHTIFFGHSWYQDHHYFIPRWYCSPHCLIIKQLCRFLYWLVIHWLILENLHPFSLTSNHTRIITTVVQLHPLSPPSLEITIIISHLFLTNNYYADVRILNRIFEKENEREFWRKEKTKKSTRIHFDVGKQFENNTRKQQHT
jgi:hypothetical protein